MNSRCSFCTKDADEVRTFVAGAGVFICDECVELCAQIVAAKPSAGARPRLPVWEEIDDDALLGHLPRIEAVRHQVDDDLVPGWPRPAAASSPGTASVPHSA